MEFYLDTADIEQIGKFADFGILDGLTTNPSILAKCKEQSFEAVVKDLCNLVKGLVSVEVTAADYKQMVEQGSKILQLAENIMLKLPITWEGIKACNYFASNGYKVNMTLCFSVNQALVAAKAGAYCVSPFIGRLDDTGHDGLYFLSQLRSIFNNYPNLKTKILAASIRNVMHLYQVAKIGADIATMPAEVMEKLINNPLTNQGLKQFEQDWAKSNMTI